MEDTRTFKRYKVTGPVEIKDGRSGELVAPGGVVELTEEARMLTVRGPNGPQPWEDGGTNVNALLYAGLVEPVADAPAKASKAS